MSLVQLHQQAVISYLKNQNLTLDQLKQFYLGDQKYDELLSIINFLSQARNYREYFDTYFHVVHQLRDSHLSEENIRKLKKELREAPRYSPFPDIRYRYTHYVKIEIQRIKQLPVDKLEATAKQLGEDILFAHLADLVVDYSELNNLLQDSIKNSPLDDLRILLNQQRRIDNLIRFAAKTRKNTANMDRNLLFIFREILKRRLNYVCAFSVQKGTFDFEQYMISIDPNSRWTQSEFDQINNQIYDKSYIPRYRGWGPKELVPSYCKSKRMLIYMIWIRSVWEMSPGRYGNHVNAVIVDNKHKRIERFEPYGNYTNLSYDTHQVDRFAERFFKDKLGEDYTYYNPETVCPNLGPQQRADEEGHAPNRGQPVGYCVTWSTMYLYERITNPDLTPEQISTLMLHKSPTKLYSPSELAQRITQFQGYIDQEITDDYLHQHT